MLFIIDNSLKEKKVLKTYVQFESFVFWGHMTQPWTHDTAVKILHSDTERFLFKEKKTISYVLHFLNNDTTGLISSLPPDPIHTKAQLGPKHTHMNCFPHLTSNFLAPFSTSQLKQTNKQHIHECAQWFLFSLIYTNT